MAALLVMLASPVLAGGHAATGDAKSIVAAGAENGLVWTEATFVAYVQNPKGFLRSYLNDKKARAKMSYKVRNEEDAHNIYAYLFSLYAE